VRGAIRPPLADALISQGLTKHGSALLVPNLELSSPSLRARPFVPRGPTGACPATGTMPIILSPHRRRLGGRDPLILLFHATLRQPPFRAIIRKSRASAVSSFPLIVRAIGYCQKKTPPSSTASKLTEILRFPESSPDSLSRFSVGLPKYSADLAG